MYPEFEAVGGQYNDRIRALRQELVEANAELRHHDQARAEKLRDVMNVHDVRGHESGIESARKRIQQLGEAIQFAHEGKAERLSSMLADVEAFRQELSSQKQAEYDKAVCDLQRRKLDYLRHMRIIGELAQAVNTVNRQANACRKEAGLEFERYIAFESELRKHAHASYFGFDKANWNQLGIPEWMVTETLNGKLPSWSEDFESWMH